MDVNIQNITGRLGKDAELKYTPNGTAVLKFSVANGQRERVNGEPTNVTTWYNVTVWGQQAENLAKYLTKGKTVFVSGTPKTSLYTNGQGNPTISNDINARDINIIGDMAAANGEARPANAAPAKTAARPANAAPVVPAPVVEGAPEDGEDIPF